MTYYEKDKKTAVVKMYADIGWWGVMAKPFTDLLEYLDNKYETVIVRMHCYGGTCYEGNPIYNVIAGMKAETIAIVEGACMSMGTILLAAFKKRLAAANANLMYHAPIGYTSGNAMQHESNAKALRILEKNFITTYTHAGAKNLKVIKGFFDGNDHHLDAEEALELGLIDEIVPPVVKTLPAINYAEVADIDQKEIYNRFAAHLVFDEEEPVEEEQKPRSRKPVRMQHTKRKWAEYVAIAPPVEEQPEEEDTNTNDVLKFTDYMKKQLIEALKLPGVTEASSDTAILETVQAAFAAKGTGGAQPVDAKKTAETLMTFAAQVTGKQLSDAAKANLLAIAEGSGLEVFMTSFTMMAGIATPAPSAEGGQPPATPAVPKIENFMVPGGQSKGADTRADWDMEKWQKEDPRGLEALEKKDWEAYATLYEAAFGVRPAK